MNSLTALALQVATFIAVVAAVVVASRAISTWSLVRRRLGEAPNEPLASGALFKARDVRNPMLQWVEGAFLSTGNDRVKLRADLVQAGFEHPAAPSFYVVARFGLAIGLPLIFIVSSVLTHSKGGALSVIAPVALSGIGLIAPVSSSANAPRRAGPSSSTSSRTRST